MDGTGSRTSSPARAAGVRTVPSAVSVGTGVTAAGVAVIDRDFPGILQFIETARGDDFARVDALYGGDSSIGCADSDYSHRGGIVRLDYVDEGALRVSLNRGGGHQGDIMLRIHQQSCVHELHGKQAEVLIWKNRLQFYRARGLVNLIIQGQKRAGGQLGGLVPGEGIDRHFLAVAQLFLNLRQVIFRDAENHGNGLKLSDYNQRGGAAGSNNVAWIH